MALHPCTKNCDYEGVELFKAAGTQQFSNVLAYLDRHGGLNAVDEYGRTALMNLVLQKHRRIAKVTNEPTPDFENTFAKELIALGCEINQRDRYGYTTLRYAVQEKNYEMVAHLLQCEGVEFRSLLLPLDDTIGELFVRAGYDIFAGNPKRLPIGSFEDDLAWHQGRHACAIGYNGWMNFEKTLTAVHELYPERLSQVPPFYLDTVAYDFLMEDFATSDSRNYASKKGLNTFLAQLARGLDSTDEYGRNLLTCCTLLYARYNGDKHLQSYAGKAVRCARNLVDMGISLSQPDFSGKKPLDYIQEYQMEEILALIQPSTKGGEG